MHFLDGFKLLLGWISDGRWLNESKVMLRLLVDFKWHVLDLAMLSLLDDWWVFVSNHMVWVGVHHLLIDRLWLRFNLPEATVVELAIFNDLESINDIDGDWTHVAADERHASLLVTRDE